MKLRASVLVLTTAFLPACYNYVPVGVESVSPGESVRARLTPEATESLPSGVRADDRVLEGEVLDRTAGGLTLFVPAAVRQAGFFVESLHERIRLSSSDVVEVERRELSRSRTYVVTAVGAAAVLGIALKTLTGKTGGNTIDRTDDGPAPSVIDVFTIRIR